MLAIFFFCFFFQAEDGIRDHCVTGVQTCALPISSRRSRSSGCGQVLALVTVDRVNDVWRHMMLSRRDGDEIGRASCREREKIWVVGGSFNKVNVLVNDRVALIR